MYECQSEIEPRDNLILSHLVIACEYYGVKTPCVRQAGNRLSGLMETAIPEWKPLQ